MTIRLPLLTAQLSSVTMSASQGSMLHLQSNMQHSPLGISIVNTHSGSVSFAHITRQKYNPICRLMWNEDECKNTNESVSQMSPFSMNGLPSPGYQCPTSIYQPTPQQVYSLTQTGQQVLKQSSWDQQCVRLVL